MERRLDPDRASRTGREGAGRAVARAAALLLAAALTACGGLGDDPLITQTEPVTVPAALPSAPTLPRSPEHVRLVSAYGGEYANPQIETMVSRVVQRLIAASDAPDRLMRVTILNSPAINAFALASGELYVTRGLVALATDESELAAVVAHEIAHVTADHALLRQKQAEAAAIGQRIGEVVEDPMTRQSARDTVEVSLATFSQQQELQADEIGVRTLARAGFDPFAASRFLGAMATFAALPSMNAATEARPGFLSSHPSTPARVEAAKRIARSFGAPGIGTTQRVQYLRSLDGMLYGDDPREGFVRGREFAHIDLGIAFVVPEGYVLKNTSAAVLATDGEHTAIRFDAVSAADGVSLADYLRSGWVKGLVEDSIRSEAIGELDVATAAALVEGWSFRIGVVRGGGQVFRFIFASSKPASEYEAAFRRTIASFRLLSPSQRAGMRPLRVRIVAVRPNEGAASLAARMDGVDPGMGRRLFEVLNGIDEDNRVLEGDLVKIIEE